jgi:hypothetical protein
MPNVFNSDSLNSAFSSVLQMEIGDHYPSKRCENSVKYNEWRTMTLETLGLNSSHGVLQTQRERPLLCSRRQSRSCGEWRRRCEHVGGKSTRSFCARKAVLKVRPRGCSSQSEGRSFTMPIFTHRRPEPTFGALRSFEPQQHGRPRSLFIKVTPRNASAEQAGPRFIVIAAAYKVSTVAGFPCSEILA